MATLREASMRGFNEAPTITFEQINCGSLQRIADATEKMAASYDNMRDERDRYKRWFQDEKRSKESGDRKIAALRGVITKMKRKEAK